MEGTTEQKKISQQTFEQHAGEKKRGMLDSFLEKHQNLGRQATTLALAMMGTVGVFAKMEHTQAATLEKPEDVMELMQDPKAFEVLKAEAVSSSTLEAPSHVKVSYTENNTHEAMNDRLVLDTKTDSSGILQMSGKNVFVASAFSDAQVSAEKNGKHHDQSFIATQFLVGETSSKIVPKGEPHIVTAYSDKNETEALSFALQDAANERGVDMTSAFGSDSQSKNIHSISLHEKKYLQYINMVAKGTYLTSYEIVNTTKSPSGVFEVKVTIQQGTLQE